MGRVGPALTAFPLSNFNGNLYGMTARRGTSSCAGGCGIIFEITP